MARGTILGVAVTTVLAAACVAQPQWTGTTDLNPAIGHPWSGGSPRSVANGVFGTQQVGASIQSVHQGQWYQRLYAGYWNNTAGSWVSLDTSSTNDSEALATNGVQQVGYREGGRAALWSGTSASLVNLHPAWAALSRATAISGSQQAGYVHQVVGVNWKARASLWSGTADSWVNLHPTTGVTDSYINGMAGTQQVGFVTWDNVHMQRAALWHGSAASYVSLHPTGYYSSTATATNGTHQVGWAWNWGASTKQASMWSGSANSFVNLNPAEATESAATSISADGELQVGWAMINGQQRAVLWMGSADSWIDLHALLPANANGWRWSEAKSVWTDGTIIRVAGFANGLTSNNSQQWAHVQNVAMLWEFEHPLTLIPLPTGAGLAFAGLGVLAARRRTRG